MVERSQGQRGPGATVEGSWGNGRTQPMVHLGKVRFMRGPANFEQQSIAAEARSSAANNGRGRAAMVACATAYAFCGRLQTP